MLCQNHFQTVYDDPNIDQENVETIEIFAAQNGEQSH